MTTRSRASTAALLVASTALAVMVAATTLGHASFATVVGTATVDRVIRDVRVNESSGLTVSRLHRGVLYTHNDSGGGPRIFAIGRTGATRAVLHLSGASARDWEDIAAGPNKTLWVADIGDNAATRDELYVYRLREPKELRTRQVAWTRYRLAYPDGSHDAEALLVRPRTGRVFIASKQSAHAAVYRAPRRLRRDRLNRLTRIRSAPERITAGDFAPDGERLVLRDQQRAYLYPRMHGRPRVLRLPDQPQGESATFARRGGAVLFGSERVRSKVFRVPVR